MNISSSYANIATIAPSVSIATEQMTRENRLREKITATKETEPSAKNKAVAQQETEPNYVSAKLHSDPYHTDEASQDEAEIKNNTEQQTQLDYSLYQFTPATYGYSAVKLADNAPKGRDYDLATLTQTGVLQIPDEALARLKELREADQKRGVVAMRYEQTSAANLPSEVLIVI